MAMTYDKWEEIGKICGYTGTKTASSKTKAADRLREACPYELWDRMGTSFGFSVTAGGRTSKDRKKIIKKCVSAGWRLRSKKSHDVLLCPEACGQHQIPVSGTPGKDSGRGLENFKSDIRRCTLAPADL